MRCSECRHDNPPGHQFCGRCGVRLPLACAACRTANPPDNSFCGRCGARIAREGNLSEVTPSPETATAARPGMPHFESPQAYTPRHLAAKILTTRSAIEGERKQVTVMFTDVSGFTAMSERLDPEDVHAIMERTFAVILDQVHRFEGTVNQFLGDGVMALFGAPIAHEDHAERALRAALAIQEGLAPIRAEVLRAHQREFQMRMGVNTGPVVVGAIGTDLRMDYTAIGDTTNLAARLLGVAQPGQIVVSVGTQRQCDGFFEFEDLGDFQLKGKALPVRAFALSGEIRGRTRLSISRTRGLTPMAGRGEERQRLMAAYRRAVEGGGGTIVLTGEAGVGKSRLLYEFLRMVDHEGPLILESTCVSYGRSVAYRPIVDLFGRYLGLPEGTTDGLPPRIAERLRTLGLESEEAATILAHFLGLSAPEDFLARVHGAHLKQRTLALLRAIIRREGEARPMVLIVENLHWIDASSEEFLGALAGDLEAQRVLLILTTRPAPPLTWLATPTETITLEGLETSDLREMVCALLRAPAIADSLLEIVLTKGAGNPLYVEEIVRSLQETAAVVIERGEARLGSADVRIPESVGDIIAARVDRLAEPLKHILQVAAVAGRRFNVSLVARVLAETEAPAQVTAQLAELHSLDFVFPVAAEAAPTYSFKHALTQEVVYASLLERRRRLYHAAIGTGLEDLYRGRADEIAEEMAHHFGRSGEDVKAVDYAILAGEKAQRRWANTEALAHFEAAVKRLTTMPDADANRCRKVDAVVKQAEVKFALGRHAEHIQTLEAIRDVVESIDDPARQAAWYCWAGFLHSLTGSPPQVSLAYCREASTIAEAHGLDEIGAIADCCLANVSAVAGDLRGALEAGERALTAFEARGNAWWASRTLWSLSMAANASGLWARSLEYCRRGLQHGRELDDLRLKVVGWWRTGSTYAHQGIPKAGLRCCDEALALSPTPVDATMARAIRGYALVKLGEIAEGVELLTEAVAWFERSHLTYTRAAAGLFLAEAHLREGEWARARSLAAEILATSRQLGYRHLEAVAERLLGEALLANSPDDAGEHLRRAEQLAEEIGARNELGKALVLRAELARREGDFGSARDLLQRAVAIFEELDTVDELARAGAELARGDGDTQA